MIYELPTSVDIQGTEFQIRSDYRVILDICMVLEDEELQDADKFFLILTAFYPDFGQIPAECYEDALKKCFWFINCGQEDQSRNKHKLMDWEKDFQYIVAPVNRIAGQEIRALDYLHWWTFISFYYEIGDCFFAQIVRIREKKATGKQLDKTDREFYKKNRDLIDIKIRYTETENDLMKLWMGGS